MLFFMGRPEAFVVISFDVVPIWCSRLAVVKLRVAGSVCSFDL